MSARPIPWPACARDTPSGPSIKISCAPHQTGVNRTEPISSPSRSATKESVLTCGTPSRRAWAARAVMPGPKTAAIRVSISQASAAASGRTVKDGTDMKRDPKRDALGRAKRRKPADRVRRGWLYRRRKVPSMERVLLSGRFAYHAAAVSSMVRFKPREKRK